MMANLTSSDYVLPLDDPRATLETVGGKGASLARLVAAGLPVPDGFHVTTTAYRIFVGESKLQPIIESALEQVDLGKPSTLEDAAERIRRAFLRASIPDDIAGAVVGAYSDLSGTNPAVAVRSSATAEDLPEASFAGQQETFLNIHGTTEVLEAVKRCWASLWTARAIGYRVQQGIGPDGLSLAVVVQMLVPAEAAGILFSVNPITGRHDQAMINAAWGLGEAVVGGLVTPDTIVADKTTGEVRQIEVADKAVMTVLTPEGTAERPVARSRRKVRVLDGEQVAELVRLGRQIEALFSTPQDIEWCWARGEFFVVQSRPITTLGGTALPQVEPPTEWKLPKSAYIAMRNNIVELMAEPLTPLFGTLGRAAINTSMGRLISSFFGRSDLVPEEMIITVNQYAYYNGSLSPWQMGRIFLHSVGIMKRMFTGAVERWTEVGRPRYAATVERWQARRWRDLSATEILSAVRELSEAAIDAYGALVSGVIPAAWISEGLFTVAYNTLIKRRDDASAPTYLLGFDSTPIRAEKSLYDLAEWVRTRAELAEHLSRTPAAQIGTQLGGQPPAGVSADDWREWRDRFQAHLQRYSHTIYSLDFADPVPADNPTPLLETLKWFLGGQGVNPHTRQQTAAEQRERATQAILNRLRGLRRKLFCKLIAWAQKYAPLREDGLADVGLSYPLVRQMLREMGRRFAEAGLIQQPDDLFWLIQVEVEQAALRLDRGEALSRLTTTVAQRKATRHAARRVVPPRALLRIRSLGIGMGLITDRGRRGNTLKGVAASPGSVTATARVVHGPEDFDLIAPGDVLVASITTPAWTPLFAMAAAVVTDVGGPLSHGSIVAREYGIPAVLGTGSATRRIRSGQMIAVDGARGIVEILGGGDSIGG